MFLVEPVGKALFLLPWQLQGKDTNLGGVWPSSSAAVGDNEANGQGEAVMGDGQCVCVCVCVCVCDKDRQTERDRETEIQKESISSYP